MRAWILTRHGDPAKAFQLREVADPEPGPHQVRIAVEGFGLNYADVMAVKGLYREAPPLPSVLGYEVVGRVEKLGAEVPGDLLGKRVVALTRFGGYAEKACTDHRAMAVVPEDLSLGASLALGTQGATTWYMARVAWPLRAGMRVLVHSAAGGVGQLLVQLALHADCIVYAVAGGAEKTAHLTAMGVQHVIDRHQGDYAERLQHLLGNDRLNVSFNAVAGSTFRKDMKLIGSGGAVVLFGGAERGRMGTLRFVWSMGLLLPIFLMMKSKSIIGVNMLKLGERDPALVAACLQGAVEAAERGVLDPHVHAELPAEHLPDAHVLLAEGGTMGKLAVRW